MEQVNESKNPHMGRGQFEIPDHLFNKGGDTTIKGDEDRFEEELEQNEHNEEPEIKGEGEDSDAIKDDQNSSDGNESEEDRGEEAEEEDQEDKGNESSIFNLIASEVGYLDQLGEDFKPEESVESVVDYIRRTNEINRNLGKQDVLNELPEVKQLYDHLKSGKSINTFMQRAEKDVFEDVELSKDNIESLETVYRAKLKASGLGDRAINTLVQVAKDEDTLYDEAVQAQKDLKTAKEEKIAQQEQLELQQREAYQKQVQEMIASVNKTIESKSLGTFKIPDSDIDGFKDFVLKPADDKGNPKRLIAYNELPLDKKLAIDYIIYKNFNVGSIPQQTNQKSELAALNKKTRAEGNRVVGGENKKEGKPKKPSFGNASLREVLAGAKVNY